MLIDDELKIILNFEINYSLKLRFTLHKIFKLTKIKFTKKL